MALDLSSSSLLSLETVVGFEDAIKNMTLEQETERYGTWDDFVSTILKKWEVECDFDPNVYDGAPPIDLVWQGWDAAYIKSKGPKACQGATLESTGLNLVIGEHLKQVLQKRKVRDFDPEVSVEIPMEVIDHIWGWWFLDLVSEIDGKALQERIFDCAVKFVLSIFDEEDFYRLRHQHFIEEEHVNFCHSHADSSPSSEDLSPNNFSYLREPDVYFALQIVDEYRAKGGKGDEEIWARQPIEFHQICFYNGNYLAPCFSRSHLPRTLELMRNHTPLKGHLQAQLILELSREKCFHVLDTLTLEAINGMNLPKYDILQEFVYKHEDGDEEPDFLLRVIDGVVHGLERISILKQNELESVEDAIIDALAYRFGPFKDEVSEVMKRANCERRIGNCRFIGLAHIWVSLSFSRVRNMLTNVLLNHLCRELCLLDGTSELYTFRLFTLSRNLATFLGHEKVGLEHLVFSIVYGSSEDTLMYYIQHGGQELFESLAECESDSGLVESWRNIDILTTVYEKRCRIGLGKVCPFRDLVKKLQQSLESGRLVLPKYDDLRVVCN